jgi:hypothetical protein
MVLLREARGLIDHHDRKSKSAPVAASVGPDGKTPRARFHAHRR